MNQPPSKGLRSAIGFHYQSCMKKWYHLLSELSWAPVFSGYFLFFTIGIAASETTAHWWKGSEQSNLSLSLVLKNWMKKMYYITFQFFLCSAPEEEIKLRTPPSLVISVSGTSDFSAFLLIAQGWVPPENSFLFHYIIYGPWTCSFSTTWALDRNVTYQAPPQTYGIWEVGSNLCLTSHPRDSDARLSLRTTAFNYRR